MATGLNRIIHQTGLTSLESWATGRWGMAAEPEHLPLAPETIRTRQLADLRRTLALAKRNSPFYAAHLAGVDPDRLTDLDDLAGLPCLSAADVRTHGLRLVCVSQDEIARAVSLPSSGTTGPPKRLFFTADDLERTVDFFRHGMADIAPPDRETLILLPGTTPDGVADLLARGLTRLGVTSVKYGLSPDPQATLAAIRGRDIGCVIGLPVQVLALAEYAVRDRAGLRPETILLSADYVPQAVIRRLETLWNCRVFSHYGAVETGLGGAVDCSYRQGMHIRAADLFFEILPPDSDSPLPPGVQGEIVVTTLTRRGMPLIRYRTGDLGRLLPGPCPCGSSLPRLGHVRGRQDNALRLPDGASLHMADLDEVLFAINGILDYTAILRCCPGPVLNLRLTALPEKFPDTRMIAAALTALPSLVNAKLNIATQTFRPGLLAVGKRLLTKETAL